MPSRQLIVMRHGPAEDAGPGLRDAARQLTPDGARQTRQACAGLARIADAPALILSSPLVRARQTAELLLAEYANARLEIEEALAPGAPREVLRQRVIAAPAASIAIVGHEPDLSAFVAWQLADRAFVAVRLGKAAVALLANDDEFSPGGAELRGLSSRKALGRLRDA
jgi:phosphohistidine phosphatase